MSLRCSQVALRVLISVLLVSSLADAAALRHQVLDTREAAQLQNAQVAAEAIQAAASVIAENPGNFFENVSDDLSHRSAWSIMKDFFERLFGPRENPEETSTVTVTVTPTPAPVETSSSPIALSSGPTGVESSDVSSTTSAPPADLMSILPVGSLTTAINATFLTPIFSTAPEESPVATPSVIEIVKPFPLFNGTAPTEPLPTAVLITDEFSVTIPVATGVSASAAANSSAPLGTGSAPAWNFTATYPAFVPSLVTGTGGFQPSGISNGTGLTLNATVNATSLVVVTATVTPIPIVLYTGTAVSVGTGLPILKTGTPLWSNYSYGEATFIAPILGTGTGSPVIGTGSPIIGTAPIIGTGSPVIGTGVPSAGSAIPVASELPLFPNTTFVLPAPILVTGVPDVVPVNITAPTNVTLADTGPQVTAFPIIVTGIPGSVLDISVSIPLPIYPNSTASDFATGVTAAPSVGTGLPLPVSLIETPLYVNTTTATSVVIETATAILIIPAPVASDAAVEFPGNATSRFVPTKPKYGY
jgi:hypothetical protein